MDLDQNEWFQSLLEDLKAIRVEYGFTSRWAVVEGYWQLGKRVSEENKNFERSKIYGENIVKNVSKSLGMSERSLQYAIQFAHKFPELETAPITKDYTWSRVVKELLPENPLPKEKKDKLCPNCGYNLSG